jgi:hypothetical protein
MSKVKLFLAAAWLGLAPVMAASDAPAAAASAAPPATKGAGPSGPCTAPTQMAILGLEMQPDPAGEAVPLSVWNVQVRSDRTGECDTSLEVMDADRVAGIGATHRILPGIHVYIVPARPGYTVRTGDRCFVVRADVGGAMVPVDAPRRFCTKPVPSQPNRWTLR